MASSSSPPPPASPSAAPLRASSLLPMMMATTMAEQRPSTPSAAMRVASLLQVEPPTVEFDAFDFDHEYVATVLLRNASDRTLRFRVTPPPAPASPFRVLHQGSDLATTSNPTMVLPPGLRVRLEVTFTPPPRPATDAERRSVEHAHIYDAFQLSGDDASSVDVPLVARRAFPQLELSPTWCDLGLVVRLHRAAALVKIRNVSRRTGRFDLEVLAPSSMENETRARPTATVTGAAVTASNDGSNQLSVTPQRGVLAPGEESSVKVELVAQEIGSFRAAVRVRIRECGDGETNVDSDDPATDAVNALGMPRLSPGEYIVEKLIDVGATVMEHKLELVLRGSLERVRQLYFGSLFAGESKTIETVLRNNGPHPVLFSTTLTFASGGTTRNTLLYGGGSSSRSSSKAGAGTASSGGGGGGGSSSSSSGGGGGSSASAEDEREAYEQRKELQVYPADGRIEPFGETVIRFTYHPRAIDLITLRHIDRRHTAASESEEPPASAATALPPILLNAFASIQSAELPAAENLTFEIAGKTFLPLVDATPSALDFGDIKSFERVDMLVTLRNRSGLAVHFDVPRVSQFAVKPATGRLDVLQSQTLIVSFVPTQLGVCERYLTVRVNGDVLELPLKVRGHAVELGAQQHHDLVGGPLALPRDFEPKYKFVLPEDATQTKGTLTKAFRRMPPYELAALNGTAAVDEYEFEGTNNTHLTYCVKELARRAEHRASYHEYLAESRRKREQQAKAKATHKLQRTISQSRRQRRRSNNHNEDDDDDDDDSGDDDGDADGGKTPFADDVNLDMEPQSGVEPRMLRLPRALVRQPDPLWLEHQNVGPGKTKLFFDDNKFVKKKFKPAPATQAELADCEATLTFDQLEMVVSGPKTIQFGKLSVNGSARRSLSVMNYLSQNILVTLNLSEHDRLDELAARTALKSQVIPPKTLGGFDLEFSSAREQFFQKTMTYTINGVHARQVTIVAEVAPIQVEFSMKELVFEFSSADTNPTMAMELTVVNTSDSPAPFQWTLLPPSSAKAAPRPDSSKSNTTVGTASDSDKTSASDKQADRSQSQAAPPKSIFQVVPVTGVLAPASTLKFQVMYSPPASIAGTADKSFAVSPLLASQSNSNSSSSGAWLENDLQLDVVGGRKSVLHCKALFHESKCHVRDKKIDLGTMAVGMEKERRVTISSAVSSDDGFAHRVVFYASIEPAAVATAMALTVSPSVGSILPQDACELSVKVAPSKPATLENVFLVLQIRGGKTLKIPILATVLIPEVQILQPTLDFGAVVIGVTVPRVVSLENKSTIAACLVLDVLQTLSHEFTITMPPRLLTHIEDVSSVFTPLMEPRSSSKSDGAAADAETSSSSDRDDDALHCARWQICIPPNTTVSFHLNLTPTHPRTHHAVFPIQFAGLPSSSSSSSSASSVARPDSITRHVIAEAVAPRLLFSTAVLDFHKCVITREGIRKVPYTKHLTLTNVDSTPLKWQIDTTKLRAMATTTTAAAGGGGGGGSAAAAKRGAVGSVIFHVAPDNGELGVGEEIQLRVSFLPVDAIEYVEDELPLLVDGKPYIFLRLQGVGMHPHLTFSEVKVTLPSVPLGVPSTARFTIQSTGYDHLELTYRVPVDLAKVPLSLHFPKGKVVSMACPNIPCEVRFVSKRSVAFNARIEFFDADGNVFYLPVAGCTENCLLTNFGFLDARRRRLGVAGQDGDQQQDESVAGKSAGAGAGASGVEFFTHAAFKHPVYLLGARQAAAERTKQQIAMEKELSAAATQLQQHSQQSQQPQQPTHSSSSSNGFVDIDASAFESTDAVQSVPPSGQRAVLEFHDSEIQFVLQYLNANFLKTPVARFPQDLADSLGKPLYELLEMVCAKRPPPSAIVGSSVVQSKGGASSGAAARSTATTTSNSSSANATLSKKEVLANYTTQYAELLKFLKSYGAMLHDVLPEYLLSQEQFVRACEDPRAEPALFSSVQLRQMPFLPRRRALEHEWLIVSTNSWMKILYQVIKCFLLFRVTPKALAQSADAAKKATDAKQALPAPVASRVCQGSNVYSEAEMVLLQWLCEHVRGAWTKAHGERAVATPPEALVLDLSSDLRDGRLLFHLLASHIPTLSASTSEYACFRLEPLVAVVAAATASKKPTGPPPKHQLQHNAEMLLHAMKCFGVDLGIDDPNVLLRLGGRELVLLLLHLHQMLPQFIPKATIEFKGALGQAMDKTIELRNPSNRVIRYQVFLDQQSSDGSGEFSIEASHVVLEPGRPVGFVVTCRPRFSRKVTARLVFQSVRDAPTSTASSGATMVFLLESNIVSRRPVRVLEMETNTYERKTLDVVIENQFLANANYKVSMTQQEIATPATTQIPSSMVENAANPKHGSGSTGSNRGTKAGRNARGKDATATTASAAAAATANATATTANAASSSFSVAPRRQTQVVRREELSAEHAWCIVAQQPFFLPEHGGVGGDSVVGGGSGGGGGGGGLASASGSSGPGIVSIRSQGSATVRVEFLPLVPGSYRCQLLFLDEKVGEFMYEIVATAHLPTSLETLEFQCELGTSPGSVGRAGSHFVRELAVPPKNTPLTKALAVYVERSSGLLKAKLKEGLKRCEETHHSSFAVEVNSPFFSPVLSEMALSYSVGNMGNGARAAKQSTVMNSSSTTTDAAASTSSQDGTEAAAAASSASSKPDVKAPKTLARLMTPRGNTTAMTTNPNSVLLAFQPKSAGVYTCKVLLHSHNTKCGSSDWRVYDLVAKVKEPNVKTLLEFVAPARHSIVQEIPLSNPSDAAWTLKALFSTAKSSFSGPSSVHVPAKKTVSYPLTFSPKWILEEKASLALTNPATQQRFEFELSGYGEEPLAQDHVVLSCQARTSVTHEFDVMSFKTDPPGEQRFQVESDLRDVVGASTVVVPAAGESVKYPLTFSPLVSGTYFGSITFTNTATREYVWYTIEATVAPPAPETTLEMETTVRSAMAVEVSLENPLEHAVEFQIELQGTGLLGPATMTLQARAAGTYELAYAPLHVTKDTEDGAVLFSNAEIGQFWYALRLRATPAAPTVLDDMTCAVGDVCTQPILLQNPSDQPLALQYRISNTRNFSIRGAGSGSGSNSSSSSSSSARSVALPAFGQASVLLEYTPSSLSDFESTRIEFFMPDVVSEWAFDVRGKGVPPSVMKPIIVRSKVREAASALFTFKNPFADALRLDVKLLVDGRVVTKGKLQPDASASAAVTTSESESSMFDILLKKPRVTLEGFGHLQVPISFLPQFVCEAHAEIVLQSQGEYAELEWRYPIRGIAEAPLHPKTFTLPCQARDSVERTLVCELLSVPPAFDLSRETITPEWEIPAERFGALASAAAIERALTITPLAPETDGVSVVVPLVVQFEPLRPYRGSIYLLLQRKTGGLWRFEVALDVSDPAVDDVITIESTLNTTSSVTFQLRNQFREPAPFQAEFSAGSSSAFTVYPTQGVLPPFGSDDGTSFVVSFTPTGYGKMQSGQLVIFTEEMQWTFNVKGAYPDLSASLASKALGSSSTSSSASRSRLGIAAATPTDSLASTKSSSSSSSASVKAKGTRQQR